MLVQWYNEFHNVHIFVCRVNYVYTLIGLKPRVRDKRLYGTGTSGIMLIPVIHPTQCAAECAKCGFSGQANTTLGPSPKRSPIQYDRPNFIGAFVRTKCTSQNSIRTCYVIGLLHTEIVWHTSQPPHSIWCSPTRPHCHWDWRRDRDWLCDGGWTLGIYGPMAGTTGQWDIPIFPTLRSVYPLIARSPCVAVRRLYYGFTVSVGSP